jgi:hypothetical protein
MSLKNTKLLNENVQNRQYLSINCIMHKQEFLNGLKRMKKNIIMCIYTYIYMRTYIHIYTDVLVK